MSFNKIKTVEPKQTITTNVWGATTRHGNVVDGAPVVPHVPSKDDFVKNRDKLATTKSANTKINVTPGPVKVTVSNNKSRGLRNNNPLNIRHSGDKFQGETVSLDPAFKTFSSQVYGYRAGFVTLATYVNNGHNTLSKIVSRWAPPSENKTYNYIKSVSDRTGLSENHKFTLANGQDFIKLVEAKSFMENGVIAHPDSVRAGFNLQNKITLNNERKK